MKMKLRYFDENKMHSGIWKIVNSNFSSLSEIKLKDIFNSATPPNLTPNDTRYLYILHTSDLEKLGLIINGCLQNWTTYWNTLSEEVKKNITVVFVSGGDASLYSNLSPTKDDIDHTHFFMSTIPCLGEEIKPEHDFIFNLRKKIDSWLEGNNFTLDDKSENLDIELLAGIRLLLLGLMKQNNIIQGSGTHNSNLNINLTDLWDWFSPLEEKLKSVDMTEVVGNDIAGKYWNLKLLWATLKSYYTNPEKYSKNFSTDSIETKRILDSYNEITAFFTKYERIKLIEVFEKNRKLINHDYLQNRFYKMIKPDGSTDLIRIYLDRLKQPDFEPDKDDEKINAQMKTISTALNKWPEVKNRILNLIITEPKTLGLIEKSGYTDLRKDILDLIEYISKFIHKIESNSELPLQDLDQQVEIFWYSLETLTEKLKSLSTDNDFDRYFN